MWNLKFIQIKDQNQSIRKSKSNKEWNFINLENCNCYHLVLTRFFVKSPGQSIKYRIISTFIEKNRQIIDVKFEIHSKKNRPGISRFKNQKVLNMERNDNAVIIGDEYEFFNLNQVPLTGLILILLTGQILNIILTKILDIILRTIINRTEVNQSRQDFNRYHLIIKIIIFVIDIIFKKLMLYLFWTFLAKYTI